VGGRKAASRLSYADLKAGAILRFFPQTAKTDPAKLRIFEVPFHNGRKQGND
jgi:hypothetical protein